jgi:hypothetical protein
MTSTMGNAPQSTTHTMVPTTNSQIHKAGIHQQVKQQQAQVQQQALQQANVFLSVDPRLMDKNIAQFMATFKPASGANANYVVEEETESLADRGVNSDDSDGWIDNPYAEPRDFYSLHNIQPKYTSPKRSNAYSLFNQPGGSFGWSA